MKKMIFGIRTVAVLETCIFLFVLFVIDSAFGSGHRYLSIYPHPAWIILLLILFQYSINEAIVAIVLMTVFLYAGNLPQQLATQSMFDYYFSLSLRPALWLGTAIVLGGLKLRNSAMLFEVQGELREARRKERVISESFTKLKEVNQALELKLSEELGSAISIYRAAVTLEDMVPENQIDGVNRIVASMLNPEKFSIFIVDENGLTLNSSYAWDGNDKYAKQFLRNSELYQAVVGEKRILAAFQQTSQYILGEEGIIAGPLVDTDSGEVLGMLKIEKMTFQSFNLRSIQLFSLLCEWIGLTWKRMRKVQRLASEAITSQTNRSYSYAFLQAQTEFLEALARRIGFHLTKLSVQMVNPGELSAEERRHAAALMSTAIKNVLRKTDLLFDARDRGEEYALLLCGTGQENVSIVVKKIQDNLNEIGGAANPAKYAFSHQVLFHSDRNPTWQGGK